MPALFLSFATFALIVFARIAIASKSRSYVDNPEPSSITDIIPPIEFITAPIENLFELVSPSNAATMTSEKAKNEIRKLEGFSATPYADPPSQNKLFSIGYGYQIRSGERFEKINVEHAEFLLDKVLKEIERNLAKKIAVPLNQNQYDAIVLFHYNIGETQFNKSTFLAKLNAADYAGAAAEFKRWNKAGGKINSSLVARRNFEESLFIS